MDLVTRTLPNGLVVASARLPGFRSAAIGAWLRIGARHEPEDLGGLAHFMEHMAFKGTQQRDARRISFEAERVGAAMNAWTARDHTAYYLTLLAEHAELAVDLLADVVLRSTFPPEELEREREVILQEIAETVDDPQDLAQDGFDATAFPDQALGRPILGDPEVIRSVRRERFDEWVGRNHVGANLVIVGAGGLEHESFHDLVASRFGDVVAGERPAVAAGRYVGGYRHVPGDFEQATVVLGWPIPGRLDPAYPAFELLAELAGGGMSSPLFQSVRERRGLAYAIDAWTEGHDECGMLQVSAGVAPRNLRALLEVVCDEMGGLAGRIDSGDLERARNQHRANLLMTAERPLALAEAIARDLLVRGRVVPLDEQVARIAALDGDRLREAAGALVAAAPTLAVVGRAGRGDHAAAVRRRLGAR